MKIYLLNESFFIRAQTQLKAEKVVGIPDIFYEFDWDNLDTTEEIIEHSKKILQDCINKIESQYNNILHYVRNLYLQKFTMIDMNNNLTISYRIP